MIYQRVSDGKSFKVVGKSDMSSVLREVDVDHEMFVRNGEEIDLETVDVQDKTEWREMH